MLRNIMRFIFFTFLCFALISYGEIKLEEIPRLNTTTALKILSACHQESVNQKVEVAIVIVGMDGRILASSKSEKMDPGLYDFARFENARVSLYLMPYRKETHKRCCKQSTWPVKVDG